MDPLGNSHASFQEQCFEPKTSALQGRRSTAELQAQEFIVML